LATDATRRAEVRAVQAPEAAAQARGQNAAYMADVRAVVTPERLVHNRMHRILRNRTVDVEAPVVPDAGPAQGPGANAGPPPPQGGRRPAGRAANVEELFERSMRNLNIVECGICNRGTFKIQGVPFAAYRCPTTTRCWEKFVDANYMYPYPVPPELSILNFVESQLIARHHPVVSVYKLKGNQLGYSGNVINFTQDVSQFATSLPHRVADLDSVIAGGSNY